MKSQHYESLVKRVKWDRQQKRRLTEKQCKTTKCNNSLNCNNFSM